MPEIILSHTGNQYKRIGKEIVVGIFFLLWDSKVQHCIWEVDGEMVYGCFMDWGARTEKICSLGDSVGSMENVEFPEDNEREVLEGGNPEKHLGNRVIIQENEEVEVLEAAPLYTSLCDIMGLDLYQTMMEIGNSERPEEMAVQYSYLFLDTEFCDAYQALAGNGCVENDRRDFTELRGLFDWLHYLKAWFVGMQEDGRLWDAEKFRSYAEHMLGTSIPVLQPLEDDPADFRQKLSPIEPDYRAVTDAFLQSVDAGSGEDIFFAGSFREVLVMETYQLLRHGEMVAVCKNCRKPFVAFNRSDTLYCSRPAPQDGRKSCGEYGAYYVRLEKVRHDEATHIYKQVYNCLQNRYRRTKTPESPEGNSRLRAETEEFLGACRAWKQKIKSGDAAEMDYIIWLHKRKGEISNGEHPGETE